MLERRYQNPVPKFAFLRIIVLRIHKYTAEAVYRAFMSQAAL